MSDESSQSAEDICLICRRPLGEVALRVINGETFCEQDAENVITYGPIGAACKHQMDLALHAISHQNHNIDGLYTELSDLFVRYGLIERGE